MLPSCVGFDLTSKYWTGLERLARYKRSSLVGLFVSEGSCTLPKFAGEKSATDCVLAVATLGDATQIGSFLFVSLGQGK
jgi:hypothetical protein